MKPIQFLLFYGCAAAGLLSMPVAALGATILLQDDFSDGNRNGWLAYNTSATGQSWQVLESASFSSGYALGNSTGSAPNTYMYVRFPEVKLEVGDSISLSMSLLKTQVATSSNLTFGIGYDGGTPLAADWFNPLGSNSPLLAASGKSRG